MLSSLLNLGLNLDYDKTEHEKQNFSNALKYINYNMLKDLKL